MSRRAYLTTHNIYCTCIIRNLQNLKQLYAIGWSGRKLPYNHKMLQILHHCLARETAIEKTKRNNILRLFGVNSHCLFLSRAGTATPRGMYTSWHWSAIAFSGRCTGHWAGQFVYNNSPLMITIIKFLHKLLWEANSLKWSTFRFETHLNAIKNVFQDTWS